jgi:2-methylisocitrate lyase-like PEP mutase family enzyme
LKSSNQNLAETFRRLHQGEQPLILSNAWDAGSARLLENLGAKAIATTSAGVAWSHGYSDGDELPVHALVATVDGLARVLKVPLTVDIESGYADRPVPVGELVGRMIDAGVTGINIEDGSGSADLLCAKIAHIRDVCAQRGVDLFVNARTDVYLRGLVPPSERVHETLARAARYVAAGADGIFVPGLTAPDEIRTVAASIAAPLNILALPGLPQLPELAKLGVRRLSSGSALAEAAYSQAVTLATAFLSEGSSDAIVATAMSYSEINRIMMRG